MTIDDGLKQLGQLTYPRKVDVVERVMAQVEQKPYMMKRRTSNMVARRWTMVAAAAVVAVLIVNVAVFQRNQVDEENMGTMLAQLNDFSAWSTVEEAANPLELFYME